MQMAIVGKYKLLIAALNGELDHHSAAQIREDIDRELMRKGVRNLVLDFSGMGFMDSSGIGLVMGRCKKVAALGGRVVVCGMNENIKRIFTMCGLQKIVTMTDRLEDVEEVLNR